MSRHCDVRLRLQVVAVARRWPRGVPKNYAQKSSYHRAMALKRKALFLFGAGASAFSGAQPTNPPLGKDLFAALEAAGFLPPGLPPEVLDLFRAQPNFEKGMEALAVKKLPAAAGQV